MKDGSTVSVPPVIVLASAFIPLAEFMTSVGGALSLLSEKMVEEVSPLHDCQQIRYIINKECTHEDAIGREWTTAQVITSARTLDNCMTVAY